MYSKKAFEPQDAKNAMENHSVVLIQVFHLFGSKQYVHKHLNFFVPFASLRLLPAGFRFISVSIRKSGEAEATRKNWRASIFCLTPLMQKKPAM